ncbi:MAG: endonuclease/exonuclease/phosphatase family protein [Alphaproteobacteria bacterium]
MTTACIIIAVCAVFCAVTPFLTARPTRLVDLPSHFAVQGTVASAFLVFFFNFLAVRTGNMDILIAVTTCTVAVIINLRTIRPYMKARAPKPGNFKILQANMLKSNTDPALLQKLVEAENPDIIACCEVSTEMAIGLRAMEKNYPHQQLALDESGYGVALLSKFPFASIENMKPPTARATSIAANIRNITFVALHTVTPIADIAARDAELAALAERFRGAAPLVVLGDFNATPWCPAMRRLCAALRLRNARLGLGISPTWPLWLPRALRLPIDHVLVSHGIPVESFAAGPSTGSDHAPTITTLSI